MARFPCPRAGQAWSWCPVLGFGPRLLCARARDVFCVLLRGSFPRLFRARDCGLGASARPVTVLASAATPPVAGFRCLCGPSLRNPSGC
eukprot:3926552-Alexandrium_andersonii.AAC.1